MAAERLIAPFASITAARDQPDAVAVAFDAEAVAIVFDFVEPFRARGDRLTDSGNAEL